MKVSLVSGHFVVLWMCEFRDNYRHLPLLELFLAESQCVEDFLSEMGS